MNKEVIGLIVGTIVIFLSFVFVCGTFLFLYLRDQKLVRLAKSSVQGTVIGYSRFREGYPPIVEYTVDGISYKKTLQYFMFKTVTIPWGTTKFLKDYTREDMLAPSITRYSNSFVSIKLLMQTHFPLHSELTVFYYPNKPTRAYVERYSGMDKFYKWFGIGFGLALVLVYGIVILAFLSNLSKIYA